MSERKPLSSYRTPGTWPVWLGMGLLRLVCLLPNRPLYAVGRMLGRCAYWLGGSRRGIVRRNISLCFPELDADEVDALTFAHFKALGVSVVEMGLGRWARLDRLEAMTDLVGLEHLQAALATGRGVILLSAHFTTLEIMGRVLKANTAPFDGVYRRNRSEFITELQRSGREKSVDRTIEKRDIKRMVRALRDGRAVWYAPDQSYDRKGAEVVDFFGVPCMHTTATSTLARLGDAIVIPFFPERLPDGRYVMTLLPPFEDFPTDDLAADTRRYVDILEQHIRRVPEQYFWIHRKFKNLPDGYPDYYADLDASK